MLTSCASTARLVIKAQQIIMMHKTIANKILAFLFIEIYGNNVFQLCNNSSRHLSNCFEGRDMLNLFIRKLSLQTVKIIFLGKGT